MASILPDAALETRLLQQVKLGDEEAISRVYETFFPSIYKFVRMQVEDTQLSEDITSDVFCKFIDSVGKRHGPQHNLRGWLYQVARNEIYRHFGKKKQLPMITLNEWLVDPSETDLEIQFMHTIEMERAQLAFRMLVREQQEVLILRFVEMLSLEETANVMKKSVSAIKSLQLRAVTTLRKLLSKTKGEVNV